MRRTRTGTWVAALLLTVTATAVLELPAAGSPGTAGNARPAAAAGTAYLSTTTVKVRSTRRVPLKISVQSNLSSAASSRSVDVGLDRNSTRGNEDHSWFFQVGKSQTQWSASKGRGSIKTGRKLGKFGHLTLTVRRAAKNRVFHCNGGGTETVTPVRVSGSVVFDTGSRAWGSVKEKYLSFGKHNTVSVDNGCQQFQKPRCVKQVTYNISSHNYTSNIFGSGSQLFATRNTSIKSPKNAFRTDTATVVTKPVSLNASNPSKAKLQMHTRSGTMATGGAKLTASQAPASSQSSCTLSGKKHTETTTNWFMATYQPAGSPLTVHFAIGGALKLPAGAPASFTRETYS